MFYSVYSIEEIEEVKTELFNVLLKTNVSKVISDDTLVKALEMLDEYSTIRV